MISICWAMSRHLANNFGGVLGIKPRLSHLSGWATYPGQRAHYFISVSERNFTEGCWILLHLPMWCFSYLWLTSKLPKTLVGGVVEKLEPSYTAGRNVKWFSHFGKVWHFLKRLNIELLCASCSAQYMSEINENIYAKHLSCTWIFPAV